MQDAARKFKLHGFCFAIFAHLFLIFYASMLPSWLPHDDETHYLAGARNLAVVGTYAVRTAGPDTDTAPGREPLYGLLLSGMFHVDPGLRAAPLPEILQPQPGSENRYHNIRYLNAIVMGLAAIMVFATAWIVAQNPLASWVAGAYVLLNFQIARDVTHAISDFLAMALVAAAGLVLSMIMRRSSLWLHALLGVILGLLCLTKAVFVGFVAILCVAGALVAARAMLRGSSRPLLLLMATVAITATIVSGWMLRNEYRYGEFAVSDSRGAYALSTREVFNDMTTCEYFASFVYWLRGPGDELARKYINPACWRRFVDEAEDGFYWTGQVSRVVSRLDNLQKSGLSPDAAQEKLPWQIIDEIAARWPLYLATMLPIFYRGLWCDEFVIFGLPALLWLTAGYIRRKNFAALVGFALPYYSLIFYTAFSLNIPRYQFTALPGFALASGYALVLLLWKVKTVMARRAATAS